MRITALPLKMMGAILGVVAATQVNAAEINNISQITGSAGSIGQTDGFPSNNSITVGQTFQALEAGLTSFSFSFFDPDDFDVDAVVMAWDTESDQATGSILYSTSVNISSNSSTFSGEEQSENPLLEDPRYQKLTIDVDSESAAGANLVVGEIYVVFISTYTGVAIEPEEVAEVTLIAGNDSSNTIAGDEIRSVKQTAGQNDGGMEKFEFYTTVGTWSSQFLNGQDIGVDIQFIPEPSTVVLLISSCGVLLLRKRSA